MSRPLIGSIGVLIIISFVLDGVAVFTPGWMSVSATSMGNTYGATGGIVPYDSNGPTWFLAASWMMFISFGLFFPLLGVYLHAGYKARHHDCCHDDRHSYYGISGFSSLITILVAVSFTLFAINVPSSVYSPYGSATASLGYSAYLALASAILLSIVSLLSGRISRRHGHY